MDYDLEQIAQQADWEKMIRDAEKTWDKLKPELDELDKILEEVDWDELIKDNQISLDDYLKQGQD